MNLNFFDEKIYVWGTGVYARKFLAELAQYNDFMLAWKGYTFCDLVKGFIDNDKKKHGMQFEGKRIYSPKVLKDKVNEICVLALSDTDGIIKEFQKSPHVKLFLYDQYLEGLVRASCSIREEIFAKVLDSNIELEAKDSVCLIQKLQECIKITEESSLAYKAKLIIKYMFLSMYFNKKESNSSSLEESIFKLMGGFSKELVAGFLKWYFRTDLQWLSDAVIKWDVDLIKKDKCTIGICIDKYWSGGVERVVSLLVDEYVQQGHKVILFLNDRNPEKDWSIPEEVKCYVMKYDVGKDFCHRMEELEQSINENQIDIMCFHSGYNSVSTFYEMLFIRMMKKPVILELHSSYPALIKGGRNRAELLGNMYRIASRVIVLSSADKEFWSSKGCLCTYIQNPVSGLCNISGNLGSRRNNKIILWVGRLVQNPKNVLDVIPIMKEVVKVHSSAKLKLLGAKERDYEYNLLIEGIKKENLENNIELCGYTKDVSSFYQEANVFLFTSSFESFSQVILESKQWGLPMVMYDIPWLELTRSKEGYIGVPQRDAEAAADAIIRLLNDDLYCKMMGDAARNSAKPFLEYEVYKAWQQVFNDFRR